MKTMLCLVELYDGEKIIEEEFDVEVYGKYEDEDYDMVDEYLIDMLIDSGYSKEQLDEMDISFKLYNW